jgi:hypothetical protein
MHKLYVDVGAFLAAIWASVIADPLHSYTVACGAALVTVRLVQAVRDVRKKT